MSWELIPIRGEKAYPLHVMACENKQLCCLAIPFIVSINSDKRVLHYWNIVISE